MSGQTEFQNLNQLKYLKFQGEFSIRNGLIDGYQLEDLIKQYIPHLNIFKLTFC